MADEISVNLTIRINNAPFDQTYQFNETFDQSAVGGGNPGKVTIGTSEEDIALGDITTQSLYIIKNLDTTNYVQVGVSATTPTMAVKDRLGAGKFGFGWLDPGATLRAQANTADVDIMLWVFEA